MSARAVSFRLPPFLAVVAGLVIAGLALVSALAMVAFSVVAGIAAMLLGRFRSPWQRHRPSSPGTELTADYEVISERDPESPFTERPDRH